MVHVVATEGRLRLLELMIGEGLVGERHAQRGGRLIVGFARKHTLVTQFPGALVIEPCLGQLCTGERGARLCGLELRIKLVDRLAGPFELRLGLVDTHLVIARVKRNQQLATRNVPVVRYVDVDDRARDARGEQRNSAVDIRVIGRDVGFEILVVMPPWHDGGD